MRQLSNRDMLRQLTAVYWGKDTATTGTTTRRGSRVVIG